MDDIIPYARGSELFKSEERKLTQVCVLSFILTVFLATDVTNLFKALPPGFPEMMYFNLEMGAKINHFSLKMLLSAYFTMVTGSEIKIGSFNNQFLLAT